jgi:FdhD protein
MEVLMTLPYSAIQYYQYRSNLGWSQTSTNLITEASVTLTVNGQDWLSIACTPTHLDALAAGFLYNEGIIQSREEIALIDICGHGTNVDVWLRKTVERPVKWQRTSGCTGGLTTTPQTPAPPAQDGERILPETLLRCMDQLLQAQEVYRETGGVHTSILSDGQSVRVKAEDIGRHNTIDKLAGHVLLDNLQVHPAILVTTGRVSSEMLQKSAQLGALAVISRTSPTSQSVVMAEHLGIVLVGYARRDEFRVYTHADRLATISAGAQALLPGETRQGC